MVFNLFFIKKYSIFVDIKFSLLLKKEIMSKIKEWWFKDALNEKESKLKNQNNITQEIVDFYDGRLYEKEVTEPTLHNNWITIEKK